MTADMSIQVKGLKETLNELRKVEPQLRKDLTKEIKGQAKPLVDAARALVPSSPPLSGMTSGRWAWTTKAKAQIAIKMGGRSRGKEFTILSLRQNNPAGAIFDMAGKKGGNGEQGQAFVNNLAMRFGAPSRSMWPAAEKMLPELASEITATIDDTLSEINKRIVTA